MSYILYIGSILNYQTLKKLIISIAKNLLKRTDITNSDDELVVSCDWFIMYVSVENIGATFMSEDYNMNLKYSVSFEVYLSEFEIAVEMMMRFIGSLLKQFSGDCILLSNGEVPVLERKNNILVFADSYASNSLFNAIEMSYIKAVLEMV